MDPESGGGNLLTNRYFGIPGWVILAGVGVLAFWWFSRQSGGGLSGGGGSSSAGSNDTLTTGDTTIDSGAVQVTVTTGDVTNNPQPKPPKKPGTATVTVPTVTHMSYPAAANKIKAAGLRPVKQKGFKGSTVEGERPYAGSKVKKYSAVTLIGSSQK